LGIWGSWVNANTNTYSNTKQHTNSHPNADSYSHSNGYVDKHTNLYGYSHTNSHSDPNGHTNRNANGSSPIITMVRKLQRIWVVGVES